MDIGKYRNGMRALELRDALIHIFWMIPIDRSKGGMANAEQDTGTGGTMGSAEQLVNPIAGGGPLHISVQCSNWRIVRAVVGMPVIVPGMCVWKIDNTIMTTRRKLIQRHLKL